LVAEVSKISEWSRVPPTDDPLSAVLPQSTDLIQPESQAIAVDVAALPKRVHMRTPIIYQISIEEQLGDHWAEWLSPLVIQRNPAGGTMLSGAVRDQAELFGLLMKICNLNLTLVAVERIAAPLQAA
jgi:hypothetical protein